MRYRIMRIAALGIWSLALLAGMAAPARAQSAQQGSGYKVQVVQVDTSRFPEVTVWVSVTDAQGNPVRLLPNSSFTVIENGKPVEIKEIHQAGEQGPVTTVLAIDRSGSMNKFGKLDAAKAAATAFVDLMRPDDVTGVIAFNTEVTTVQPLTSDKDALKKAIAGITAVNDTAMYDALAASEDMLKGVQGRRAVIILSDGLDNRSKHSANDILGGLQQAELSVYTIGLGDPSIGIGSMAGINEAALKAIADKSRGVYTYAPNPKTLGDLYQQLSSKLQNEYRLTYVSQNTLHDGIQRGIEVQLAEGGSVQATYNPGGVIPETTQALAWPVFGALLLALVALLAVPDLIRGATHGAGGLSKRMFKKSRVKLSGANSAAAAKPQAKSANGKRQTSKPRVRVKGG